MSITEIVQIRKCFFSQKFVKSRFSIQQISTAQSPAGTSLLEVPLKWNLLSEHGLWKVKLPTLILLYYFFLLNSSPYLDRHYFSLKKASFKLSIKEKYANVKLIKSLRTSYPAHQCSVSKVGCSSKVCRCFTRFTRPLPLFPFRLSCTTH